MRLLYFVTMAAVIVYVTSANRIASEHSSLRASILSKVGYTDCSDAGLSFETTVKPCTHPWLRAGSKIWPNLDVAIKIGKGYCFFAESGRLYNARGINRPEDECLVRKYPICKSDPDCQRYFPAGATCVLRRPFGSGRKRCRPTKGFNAGIKCWSGSKQCRQGLRCSKGGYCEDVLK